MPQIPVANSEVVINDSTSVYNKRTGVVISLIAATDSTPASAVVALRPAGGKSNTAFNDRRERRVFRYTQFKVVDGSGSPGAVDIGNAATDTRLTGQVTTSHPRFTPSPMDRKLLTGTKYHGVEPKATASERTAVDYCVPGIVGTLNTESEQYANLDLCFPLMGVDASTVGSVATELVQAHHGGLNNDVVLVSDNHCTVPEFNNDGGDTGFVHTPNVSPANKILTVGEAAVIDSWEKATICCWIKTDNEQAGQGRFIDRAREQNGDTPTMCLSVEPGGTLRADFNLGTIYYVSAANVWTHGYWHHVAASLDDTSLKLWHNGVIVDENTNAQGNINQTSNQGIGIGNQIQRNRPFKGQMRDVRFYNKGLSAAVMQQIYANPYDLYDVS